MFTFVSFIKFLISFLMIFISSYFLSSVFSPKDEKGVSKYGTGFLYLLLCMFAQIVISFEFLSLFKAINEINVLLCNVAILFLSLIFWFKQGRPIYRPQIFSTFLRIFKGLKKDKILMIMAFGFLFFIAVTVIMNLFMPVSSYDALTYHLNRSSFWLTQGSLNHFITADDRNLVMPINSEILYLWVLLFLKNDIGLSFFTFLGYIASLFSVYNILTLFRFSERKKLWSLLILSSFASVIAEVSSVETDVLIAGLVLTSITLFLTALKERKLSLIFFSSLAYALAMGTKTPSIIAFPGVFLLLSFFAYKDMKKEFYKPMLAYLGFLFINFCVFSGYNYVLNFLSFGSFLGSESAREIHGFRGGFKAIIANYIRYIFMMFDFSGFRYSDYVGEHINNAKFAIFDLLKIPHELGVEMSDENVINNRLMDVKMGTGLLGFLVFLPSLITSFVIGCFNKAKKKAYGLWAFSVMFFVNLLCLSFSLAYMVFSVRFVTFLIVISSPVLAISYMRTKNVLTSLIKLMLLFFVMSYFLVMSTNLASRQFSDAVKVVLKEKTLNDAREKIRCALFNGYEGKMPFCYLRDIIRTTPKGTYLGIFPSVNSRLYVISMLNNEGYKIDVLLPENAPNYDLSKYDYLVTTDKVLTSSVLLNKTKDTKIEYKINENGEAYYNSIRPFSCIYADHYSHQPYNPAKKGQVIVTSSCYLMNDFFTNKGFSFVRSYDFQSVISENSNYMTIYKNNNK